MGTLLIALGAIVGVGLLLVYGAFTWGFVFYKYYYWFVLPVFTTAPQIDFYQAVGLMMFLGLFKSTTAEELSYKGEKIEKKPNWVVSVILPWLILAVAWFIKLFI